MIVQNVLTKLEKSETLTSDALTNHDIDRIENTIRENKKRLAHFNTTYRTLLTLKPDLKSTLSPLITEYQNLSMANNTERADPIESKYHASHSPHCDVFARSRRDHQDERQSHERSESIEKGTQQDCTKPNQPRVSFYFVI